MFALQTPRLGKHLFPLGGGLHRHDANDLPIAAPPVDDDLVALDEALTRFAQVEPQKAELVKLRYFVGLTIEETADPFGRGEVLVRQVMGADRDTGAVAVGETVTPGQTLQFYVRDADSADEELNRLLRDRRPDAPPAAGLLFSCNGRGTRMFPRPHHDAQATDAAFPNLPVAGFFAGGEIGAVGGVPFLHGHTASIALILPDTA